MKVKLNLQVEKVNRDVLINFNIDCIFDSRLSMFFLHVGIADIYQGIHPLINPETAKACFRCSHT
jgi:hypothetical protein